MKKSVLLNDLIDKLRSGYQSSQFIDDMKICHCFDVLSKLQNHSVIEISTEVMYSLATLSVHLISYMKKADCHQWIKILKKFFCVDKSLSLKNTDSWINCLIKVDDYPINQLNILSMCVDEFKDLHSMWKIHLLELIRLNADIMVKCCDSIVESDELLLPSTKFFLKIFQTFKEEVKEIIKFGDHAAFLLFTLVGEKCFYIIGHYQNSNPSLCKFCGSIIAHLISYQHENIQSNDIVHSVVFASETDVTRLEIMPGIAFPVRNLKKCLIWIVYGLLSCKPELVFRNASSLIVEESFKIILSTCRPDSSIQYHGFSSLQLWWKQVRKFSDEEKSFLKSYFNESTLDLIWNNWDSQVCGAVDILLEIFSHLLDTLIAGDDMYTETILDHLLNTSDDVRGKYGPLAIFVKKFGYDAILAKQPRFVYSLIHGLGINHLASCASKVYKAIASVFSQRGKTDFDSRTWEDVLGASLVDALLSSSRLTQQNAISHWLLVNAHLHSTVLARVLRRLDERSSRNSDDFERLLSVRVGVMNVARRGRALSFKNMDSNVIGRAIVSNCDETRANAFSLVCKAHGRSEALSPEELALLVRHTPLNMNIDCVAFRHEFCTSVQFALDRIRCSILAEEKQRNSEDYIGKCVDFLTFLHRLCVGSLSVCSTYQRKATALSLFGGLLKCFASPVSHLKIETLTVKNHQLMNQILNRFNLDFVTQSNADVLLALSDDVVSDVRETALELLLVFFPTEVVLGLDDAIKAKYERLLNSPKAQDTESGSTLAQFYYRNIVMQSRDSAGGDLAFLRTLLNHLRLSSSRYRSDTLKSSYDRPLHGWLQALSSCLDATSVVSFDDRLVTFLRELDDLVVDVIHFLLRHVYSCCDSPGSGNEYVASADFREISKRIVSIIAAGTDNETTESDEVLLSNHFEIVLSGSWLALKNSCNCLSSAGCLALRDKSLTNADEPRFEAHCRIFVTVLSMCRHRGVVESCYASFVKFLTGLFASQFHRVPVDLFWSLLANQGRKHKAPQVVEGGTITRRSAGVPLVIDAILTAFYSLKCPGEKNLLAGCVDTLLDSLAFLNELDERSVCVSADLPQVDALYILKSILQNNKLASHVGSHLPSVFVCAINCLGSSLWIVRNAATHLLGIMSARMLGQKHIEKESTNSLTVTEFFTRFPALLLYFKQLFDDDLKLLSNGDTSSNDRHYFFKPSVYVVVTLLSKLVYDCDHRSKQFDTSFISTAARHLLICRFYSLRTAAVRLILASCSNEHVLAMITDFITSLPSSVHSKDDFSLRQNELHGCLLLLRAFLKKRPSSDWWNINKALLNSSWLADLSLNPCPLTAALYLKVVVALNKSTNLGAAFDCDRVLTQHSVVRRSQVGHREYERALAKLIVTIDGANALKRPVFESLPSTVRRFTFENLAKRDSFRRDEALTLLAVVSDAWTRDVDEPALETAFANLFIKLRSFVLDNAFATKDEYQSISKRVFSSTRFGRCLSLECSRIKAMSLVVAWGMRGGGKLCSDVTLKQHLNAWVDRLDGNTFATSSAEPLRLSSATSLKLVGSTVLDWIKQNDPSQYQEITSSLCCSSLLLLHDEQREIREPICAFISQVQGSNCLGIPQHYYATELLLSHFSTNFSSLSLLEGLMNLCCQVEPPPVGSCNTALYRQEAFNLYVEFEQLALKIRPHAKVMRFVCALVLLDDDGSLQDIAKKLLVISEGWVKERLKKCEQLLHSLERCLKVQSCNSLLRFAICGLVYIEISVYATTAHAIQTHVSSLRLIKDCLISVKGIFPYPINDILCSTLTLLEDIENST